MLQYFLLYFLFFETFVLSGEDIEKTYAGVRNRKYIIHLPTGYTESTKYALVMVLHGCSQDYKVIKHDTDMDRISDSEGFIAVYPFITSYGGLRNTNCWGFWFPAEIGRGKGEVGDLAGIVNEVAGSYSVDMDRVHITGLSSGGAMTVVAATAYPDLFASAAPGAGIGYSETASTVTYTCLMGPTVKSASAISAAVKREMGDNIRRVPLIILHSTTDCTVQLINAERIRDSWGLVFGVDTSKELSKETGSTKGKAWTRMEYGDDEGILIETHFVNGINHGWVGGVAGLYSFPNGPDWSAIAWDFFKKHPKNNKEVPTVTINTATGKDLCVFVDGEYTNPNGDVASVQVRLSGLYPIAASPALLYPGEKFMYEKCELTNNSYYSPAAFSQDSAGTVLSEETLASPIKIGEPPMQAPIVTPNPPQVSRTCVRLSGKAHGETDLIVEARLDAGVTPGPWQDATWDSVSGQFETEFCGLSTGSYRSEARATDELGMSTVVSFTIFNIDPLPYDQEITDTLTNHVATTRVTSYMTCLGFGTCDTLYNTLLSKYGSTTPFTVYHQTGTNKWFELAENIPSLY